MGSKDKRRICVVGAGAIGTSVAAALSMAGHRVNLVAWGNVLDRVRAHGLRYADDDGARTVPVHAGTADDHGVQDVVFVALKSDMLVAALPLIRPLIGPHTMVVPLVNGIPWWYFASGAGDSGIVRAVDPDGLLNAAVPADQIVGSVVYIAAERTADHVTCISGPGRLILGDVRSGGVGDANAVARLFAGSELAVTVSSSIRADLWSKVALNLATYPLSVVMNTHVADQFHKPDLLRIVTTLLNEAISVARAHGVEPSMTLDEMVEIGRRVRPGFRTSMARDYLRGRRLELGGIGHAALEMGYLAGIDMPTAQMMIALAERRGLKNEDRRLDGDAPTQDLSMVLPEPGLAIAI